MGFARVTLFMIRLALLLLAWPSSQGSVEAKPERDLFASTFDAHWEALRDQYPYFELYGVDWEAEREEHRPRAVAAANADEFAWEMARLFMALPDPHLAFIPSLETLEGRWSMPELETRLVERRILVTGWPAGTAPEVPAALRRDAFAYPEIVAVRGIPAKGIVEILAAGPVGSPFDVILQWPDGSETGHTLHRPAEANLPPPEKQYGQRWIVVDRIGDVGYLRVKTFDPKRATLGPDGKMTTMLRAALKELADTRALILDLQANGGGMVAASDPFLGNLIGRTQTYSWGNSGGKRRVIRPRRPRYEGSIVALVDEGSASGGEWAARILRDAGRAQVVGGPTVGAEAAVLQSKGPDGSVLHYSGWPIAGKDAVSFQHVGIDLDHVFPLTVADIRRLGFDEAKAQVRRERFGKALELLEAPATDLEALLAIADAADGPALEDD